MLGVDEDPVAINESYEGGKSLWFCCEVVEDLDCWGDGGRGVYAGGRGEFELTAGNEPGIGGGLEFRFVDG